MPQLPITATIPDIGGGTHMAEESLTLTALLKAAAAAFPSRRAVVVHGKIDLTHAALDALVDAAAARLHGAGVRPGHRRPLLPQHRRELSAEDKANLVESIKNTLQGLAARHTDVLEPNVRKRVDVLREIQSQHDELEAKFFEERAALEAKYQKMYEPLY